MKNKKGIVFIGLLGVLLILFGVYLSGFNNNVLVDKNNSDVKKYLVEFDTSGGSLVDNQYIEFGSYVLEPATPVKEGFVFLYWEYNGKKFDFGVIVTNNIVLSAVWEELDGSQEKYTVSFNTVGGNILDDIVVLANNSIITLPIPKKEGYVFKNWKFEDQMFYNSLLVDKNMTLVAVWEKVGGNNASSDGNNIIGNGSNSDNDEDNSPVIPNNSLNKIVRDVSNLKVVVDSSVVTFSDYNINFSDDYDKNKYYSSVDGYEILKSSTSGGKYEVIGKTTALTYKINNADVSRGWYYAFRAYKRNDGKTEYSKNMKIVYVPKQLVKPINVLYTANQGNIKVTFDINDSDVYQYQVLKKSPSSVDLVATSTNGINEISWNSSNYACYVVRGFAQYGNDVTFYGFASREVCFEPILEKVQNINTSLADVSTGFDYKTTWNTLQDKPNSYLLDVYRKDASGNVLNYTREYLFSNTYFNCKFSNGEYSEIHVHGYDKTGDYELIGPANTFITR